MKFCVHRWRRHALPRWQYYIAFVFVFVCAHMMQWKSLIRFSENGSSSTINTTNHDLEEDVGVGDTQFSASLSANHYPLSILNISSATLSYERGFWQRSEPVPLSRWNSISNLTCLDEKWKIDNHTENSMHASSALRRNDVFQHRVPLVFILGAQKGGTTALANYLYTHPHIQRLPTKELRFFDEILDQNPTIISDQIQGIPSNKALEFYQQHVIGNNIPFEIFKFSTYLRVIDATPNYLFVSDRVPQRVLCVTPWAKLIVLLRNPVDRAFSQYNMQFHRDMNHPENRRGFLTFEEYVEMDIQVLTDLGVLPNDTKSGNEKPKEYDFLSSRVQQAWATYTKMGLNSPIGRGLYIIQLSQWFRALKAAGRSPDKEVLVLRSETMNNNTKTVYDQVLRFLGLPPHTLPKFGKIHATSYRSREMTAATQSRLKKLFHPFNQQLGELLGKDWDGVWQ